MSKVNLDLDFLKTRGLDDYVLDYLCLSSSVPEFTYANIRNYTDDSGDFKSLLTPKMFELISHLFFTAYNKLKMACLQHSGSRDVPDEVFFDFKDGWTLVGKHGPSFLGKLDSNQLEKISIGLYSYMSGKSVIDGSDSLSIGSFCSIAADQFFFTSLRDHPSQYPSTYNFHGNSRIVKFQDSIDIDFELSENRKHSIIIENDVWIGRNCTVMPGIKIADGSIIGANSTVTKSTEPYGVYAGSSAKLIRKRFTQDIIDTLLDIAWWDWNLEKLQSNRDFLNLDLTNSTPQEIITIIK